MPRNIREKIIAILADSYDLKQASTVTKLENLLKEELAMKDEERTLTYIDLMQIKSDAAHNFVNMPMSSGQMGPKLDNDKELVRFLCIVDAVVGFMRRKQLINFLFTYDKK